MLGQPIAGSKRLDNQALDSLPSASGRGFFTKAEVGAVLVIMGDELGQTIAKTKFRR
jgi:hypothetical protein